MSLKNLPPTVDLAQPTGSTIQDLQAEVIALRILAATLVWKAGGSVNVSQADMELATMTCQLHALPIPSGTRWYVEELTKSKTGNG